MTIRSGSRVTIDYRLLDGEGRVVEDTTEDEPVTYEHGTEEILPGLEEALEGRAAGDELEVVLEAADAYGEYDPSGLFTIPRDQLPADFAAELGEQLTLSLDPEEAGGEEMELEVHLVESHPDQIVVDANHPLAGKTLTFEVKVRSVE